MNRSNYVFSTKYGSILKINLTNLKPTRRTIILETRRGLRLHSVWLICLLYLEKEIECKKRNKLKKVSRYIYGRNNIKPRLWVLQPPNWVQRTSSQYTSVILLCYLPNSRPGIWPVSFEISCQNVDCISYFNHIFFVSCLFGFLSWNSKNIYWRM